MSLTLATEVRMIKGVGPQRAELLAHEADQPAANEQADSTEVGRIVPIYEAVGTFGSRAIRRTIYTALQLLDPRMPDVLPEPLRARLGYPSRYQALAQTHFPPPE